MLKISQAESADSSVTLRLEGRIVGPWVAELRQSCEANLRAGRSLRLHLADVEFMDADAVTFLASLPSRDVALIECPLFATEQLRAEARTRNCRPNG